MVYKMQPERSVFPTIP